MTKIESNNMSELIKKPELYLGIVTLLTVGFFVVKATYKPAVKMVTPITPKVTISPSQAPTPSKAIAEKKEEKKTIKMIKKFADTGLLEEKVQSGDSFWKIAERACGSGVFADSIQLQNGYENKALQPGDRISVACN